RAEREQDIALCQLHLGNHAPVIQDRLRGLRDEDSLSALDAWILTRLYRDAGQIGDLTRILKQCEKNQKREAELGPFTENQEDYRRHLDELRAKSIGKARDLLHVEALVEKKDLAALIALCQKKDDEGPVLAFEAREGDSLLPRAAAGALASLDAVEPIKSALAERPKVTGWLVYAL